MASVLLAAWLLLLRFARLTLLYVWSLIGSWRAKHFYVRDAPRLSKPISHLKASYDVVVIGSGYGGGVAACRMARATPRHSVCLLERGRERWPGEYPSSLWAAISELKFTGHIRTPLRHFAFDIGKRTGLYHWFVGKGSNVLVGSGLGGTSLMNAGVFVRPCPEVLQATDFPAEIRCPGSLDEYYQRAEAMLEPTSYPSTIRPPRKFKVLQQQAAALGRADSCYLVPQTTSFESRINAAGVKMQASTLSSQESMGSNDGSKNSTLVTYLADAWASGSEIFCDCDVRYVQKHPVEGYLVFFRKQGRAQLSWIHARKFVFLGAGALGSTEIVLRSQQYGLRLGSHAGANISTNGSMLAFGYDLNLCVNSVGTAQAVADPPGPTIAGTIDCRNSPRLHHQFMIQDGAFPTIMAVFFRMVRIFLPKMPSGTKDWRNVIWKRASSVIRRVDALQNTQCYLVLGHDNSGGSVSLEQDKVSLDLRNIRHTSKPGHIKKILLAMTHALDGVFVEPLFGVVVHPLGGLGMSSDGTGRCGATIHTGEILCGDGTEVHEGLVVVDGAIMPRSLGSNPLATICALAERSVQIVASERDLSLDLVTKRHFESLWAQRLQGEKEPHIEFSETMDGDLPIEHGHSPIAPSMTITVSEAHSHFTGKITGTMRCLRLSKNLLVVDEGSFRLFELDPTVPMQRKMIYDLKLISSAGEEYHLHGVKTINTSIGPSPLKAWRATTTLATTLETPDGTILGPFELHISLAGFLRQLRSLRVLGSDAQASRKLLLKFMLTFATRMYEVMFVPFATNLQYTEDAEALEIDRDSKMEANFVQQLVASDGVETSLRMWQPIRDEMEAAARNLLFIPGGAVTHEIYSLPTIKTNAIEYFTVRGFRCWCVTHRAATVDRAKDKRSWTTFDARLDIKAALAAIRKQRGTETIIAIGHCVGSGALACGLLDGTIPSQWLSGIVASQFFLHPLVTRQNQLKARLPLVGLYRWLAGDWFACNPTRKQTILQTILTQVLRFYPQSGPEERCNSVVCLRNCLPFGRLWNHANLNNATHSRLGGIFSGVSTDCIEHLAGMGLTATINDKQGRSLVTDANVERLRGVPMFLFAGADNQVYQTSAILRTQELLQSFFGAQAIRHSVFQGLGHLDCWMSDVSSEPSGVFETIEKEIDLMLWSGNR